MFFALFRSAIIFRALLEKGWEVTLGGRRRNVVEALAKELGSGEPVEIDLTDASSVTAAVESCGDLDGVVQAAGSSISMTHVSQASAEELTRALAVESSGLLRVIQAALPGLRRRRGNVVAVTSAGLLRHPSKDVLSTAPKAAAEAIIRGIAKEEGRYGVRANSVAVGVVEAGMFERLREGDLDQTWQKAALANIPLSRFGRAEDVASAVCFLLGDQAEYITGQRLVVDGGYSC